ncbi:LysR substrate-binding domain-containing protein [Pseudorhodoferax sp. LjRoot39]|uniref:LysR substrate-binding domain-containing protein n=1 Tax=Pseudorhodoferax sp. LjRoot39 TaxID=3342328 RepID=UPI003ED11B36
MTSACVAAGFSPRIHHHARHLLTTLSLVATSGGVSLVPESLMHASLPGVALRPLSGSKVASSYSLVWNPANPLPVLPRVRDVFLNRAFQWTGASPPLTGP